MEALYRKYSRPPKSLSDLNIDEFIATCGNLYGIVLSDDSISFTQMSSDNPFHSILLRNVYGIEKFEYHMALVTSSYILFFNRDTIDVTVHFKPEPPCLSKRLYCWIKYKLFRSSCD